MKKFSLLLFVLAVVLTFASGLLPVRDYDFFWHLKTGEWIWQNKELPAIDPFSFTFLAVDETDPFRPLTILKSYWLSQLFFYGLYSVSGFKGIIIFRAIVFCIILLVLWRTMARDKIDYRLRIIMLIPYIVMCNEYQKERPQLFSFAFAAIVLYILEGLRKNRVKSMAYMFLLPMVMLVWVNMHGGFPVGMAFIATYIAGEWLSYIRKPLNSPPLYLTVTGMVSILFAFLNPNTYKTLITFLNLYQDILTQITYEFLSPFAVYKDLGPNWYSYWFLLMLSVLVILTRLKKLNITELFILTGTIIASISAVRYVFFFIVAAIPIIARHFNESITNPARTLSSSLKARASLIIQYGLLIFFVILIYKSPLSGMPLKEDISRDLFPVEAVSFIELNNPPGLMFNDAEWGGYLIWRLYPRYPVFIDTRTLNIEVFRQYYSVLGVSKISYAGQPEWKGILKSYGVNIILTPAKDRYTGELLPLMTELINDDEWALVYRDRKATIFIRRAPGTMVFIERFNINKQAVLSGL